MMHSIKTAVVVSILLVVGYAVYTSLNNERSAVSPSGGGDDWPHAVRADARDGANGAGTGPSRPSERPDGSNGASAPRRPWDIAGNVGDASNDPSFGPSGTPPSPAAKSDRTAVDNPLLERPGAARQASDEVRPEFRELMAAAQREIQKGSLVGVLRDLTPLHGRPSFSADESRHLTELLSQLAGEVIYSRKHYIESPYVVREGDSLQQIAQQHQVPWQLLAKINGVQDPDRPAPGTKLKVLRGPFDAIVLLDRYELVLQIGGLYAGRFPIGVGRDHPRLEGAYAVKKKMTRPTYYGPNGTINPGDSDNPLGKYWIGLDEQIGIHGTNDMRNLRRGDGRGTVCLGDRDIEDVYDILSAESPSGPGSKVVVRWSAESPEELAQGAAGRPDRR